MGTDHFNANFWFGYLSQEQVLDSMTLFAEEVLPVLQVGRDVGPVRLSSSVTHHQSVRGSNR